MSLGIIPEIKTPAYEELRNRDNANWYSDEMKDFLSSKLGDSHKKYTYVKKLKTNYGTLYNAFRQKIHKIKILKKL